MKLSYLIQPDERLQTIKMSTFSLFNQLFVLELVQIGSLIKLCG